MPKYLSATPTSVVCKEQAFPEFTDMLFGKSSDGTNFFDATHYLQKRKSTLTPDEFFRSLAVPIEALVDSYEIPESSVHAINEQGHHLIDGNLIYLFISFVEPSFWTYMFDRIHEMFSNGFCISDTYILGMAKERLSNEALMSIMDNG